MEDKESTESDSPGGNSEFDSTPESDNGSAGGCGGGVSPQTINMAVNIDTEKNAGVTSLPTSAVGGGGAAVGGELMNGKKKRGRPRKYDSDGNIGPGYMRWPPYTAAQPVLGLSTSPFYEHTSGGKRGRGKSSAELFLLTARGDFVPHVLTVFPGEDVGGKILAFAREGGRGICLLSANGSISNVTIRQPSSSPALFTYEGRFEILSLIGSYTFSDNGGPKSRSGGLSVSLASPDGRVIGGGVAGLLIAATPIQIVVGSFEPKGIKTQKRKNKLREPKLGPIQFSPAAATVTEAMPVSQAPPAGSNLYLMPMSQSQVQNQGEGDQSLSYKARTSTHSSDGGNDSGPISDHIRPSSDINS